MSTLIYYFETDRNVFFYDDYFEAYSDCTQKEEDDDELFFIKGEFESGKTWKKSIHKLKGYSEDRICNQKLIESSLLSLNDGKRGDRTTYLSFKDKFMTTCYKIASQKKNIVLMSGDVDSKLIALVLKTMGCDVSAYIARHIPYAKQNNKDVNLGKDFCEKTGIPCRIIECDYDLVNSELMEKLVYEMPCSAHLGFVFMKLLDAVPSDDIQVWCGQNADDLYNLSASARFSFSYVGLFTTFKRMCLTDEYFNSFSDSSDFNVL